MKELGICWSVAIWLCRNVVGMVRSKYKICGIRNILVRAILPDHDTFVCRRPLHIFCNLLTRFSRFRRVRLDEGVTNCIHRYVKEESGAHGK